MVQYGTKPPFRSFYFTPPPPLFMSLPIVALLVGDRSDFVFVLFQISLAAGKGLHSEPSSVLTYPYPFFFSLTPTSDGVGDSLLAGGISFFGGRTPAESENSSVDVQAVELVVRARSCRRVAEN